MVKCSYPSAISCSHAASRIACSSLAPRRRVCLSPVCSLWLSGILPTPVFSLRCGLWRKPPAAGSGCMSVAGGGEGEGGDECGDRDADRPPERALEGAGGSVREQGLEGDGNGRDAEGGADLLGDAGVHGGVGDASSRDVLVGDRHRRSEERRVGKECKSRWP